jgi:hypothetical protein
MWLTGLANKQPKTHHREWHEDTQIEPAEDYETSAEPLSYLEALTCWNSEIVSFLSNGARIEGGEPYYDPAGSYRASSLSGRDEMLRRRALRLGYAFV